MRTFLFRLLFDPAPTDGNGSGAGAGSGTGDANANKNGSGSGSGSGSGDSSKGYEAALAKHGNDAATLARMAYADNEKLRTDLANAQAKIPKDGSVILSGDDAAKWSELGKLGTLDEIKTKLTAGDTAASEVSAFRREKLLTQAAATVGFDPEVLGGLPGVADLVIEIKDGTRNGKPAKIAEVVTKETDDKGAEIEKRTPLDKFAELRWGKFMPSLKVGASATPSKVGGTPSRSTQPRAQGTGTAEGATGGGAGQSARRRPSF